MTSRRGPQGTGSRAGVLVVGLAVSGEAVARRLVRDGVRVVAVDDRPGGLPRCEFAGLELERQRLVVTNPVHVDHAPDR